MSHIEALGAPLPTLPQLGRNEVSAVRRFQPGKWLGRITALLWALLPLVLAFLDNFGLLHGVEAVVPEPDMLRNHPWYSFATLCGFSLLAIVFQAIVERRAKSVQRALQALAVRPSVEQSGYFRIGPYLNTAEDRARFSRADRAHEKVLSWIERSTRVPLYLTGDSGSGKSSLLNAFVLPTLRERGWTVVEARAWQDADAAVRDALAQILGPRRHRQTVRPRLRSLIEAAARRADARLLLVLDQFEEFVILGKPQEQQALAALLTDLQSAPVEGLSLLLVLRSDYQIFLEDIGLPLLQYGENLYQVGRFPFVVAGDFLSRSGLELQPAAIDRLLASAAELDETPGLVRPITLNVIGYVLASGEAVAPSLDAGQLVRRYIEQTIDQPAIRDLAPPLLEHLITEQGTKRPRSEQELATSTHLRHGEVRAVLNGLGAAALARPLDPDQGVWELSHDFIARAVARYLGRPRRDLLRRTGNYALPALFTAMVLITIGAVAWHRLSPYQIRASLADLGLTVTPIEGGLAVEANSHLTSENFAIAGPLLAELTAVRSLNVGYNKAVENLEPLRSLSALQDLDLPGTEVENFEPLKGLTALRDLDLSETKVENLEPLKGLTALQHLDLGEARVENLEPLKGLTALQSLVLRSTKVENLEPLRDLTALQSLGLRSTKVENFEPLRGLTALQKLDLGWTKVENLEPLKGLTALQELDLVGTEVENLEPLKGLTALRVLHLNDTRVQNLEPLKGLTALRVLDLNDTRVENLEPINGLTALQELDLVGTEVENLEPLKGLTALQQLWLPSTLPEAELTHFNGYRQGKNLQPVKIFRR
jgi:hypothetical protein